MINLKSIYLYLQKILIKHSTNNNITRKRIKGILGWFGIPKNKRYIVINLMVEKKLLKQINKKNFKIINTNLSKEVDKNILKEIYPIKKGIKTWEEIL